MRPTHVDVDLAAIRSNLSAFVELVAPAVVCAVVKADGYGHGDVPVAEAALAAGAGQVAVALVEEGIRLREAGIGGEILVLSEPRPDSVEDIVKWELTPTVYSETFVSALAETGARCGIHLKVDTGMHRVGARPDAARHLVTLINTAPNLSLDAIWTHFSVADEDPEYTRKQIDRFQEAIDGIEVPGTHLANTAGSVLFPQARADMCRIGLGTYGLHPCEETRDRITLTPAMRMVSAVTHVQRLKAGERPSYGRVRELGNDATVVTVPVGYADGFSFGRRGDVLINGSRHPLAGRVTMDQVLVDMGDEDVSLGDEVVLLGRQGDQEITADEWASDLGTLSYEVICTIGPRVPRRYVP